jgi:cytochrome c553
MPPAAILMPSAGGFCDDDREVAERDCWREDGGMTNCKAETPKARPRDGARRHAGSEDRAGGGARAAVLAVAALWAGPALADVEGDRELGAYLSSECLACHQLSGKAVGAIPAIVGHPAESFVALMNAYRRKERENETMRLIAAKFRDEEIAALAVYFESVKPQP